MAKGIHMLALVLVVFGVTTWAKSAISKNPSSPHGPRKLLPRSLPHPPPSYPHPNHKEKSRPYSFAYGIKDDYVGANYGQEEASDGQLVKGSFYVALPDGRLQTVNYQADHVVGYVADVEYKGEAQHPPPYAPSVTYKPRYPPPPPPPPKPSPTPAPTAKTEAPTPAPTSTTAAPTTYPDEIMKEEYEA